MWLDRVPNPKPLAFCQKRYRLRNKVNDAQTKAYFFGKSRETYDIKRRVNVEQISRPTNGIISARYLPHSTYEN